MHLGVEVTLVKLLVEARAMSQAEAFGHFRSFAAGLENSARALRKILENRVDGEGWSSHESDNGFSGISTKCSQGKCPLRVLEDWCQFHASSAGYVYLSHRY